NTPAGPAEIPQTCPKRNPAGPWTRPPPARHAGLRHARRKATTSSNQKQKLPTTGQTSKAHGIGTWRADAGTSGRETGCDGFYGIRDDQAIRRRTLAPA